MSALRPTLRDSTDPATVAGPDALLCIYGAVRHATRGLTHGRLHASDGRSCAIGEYFNQHPRAVLPTTLVDTVAAVNDSVPSLTPIQRREYVLRWLRWKLTQAGMPGFRTTTAPARRKARRCKGDCDG